jgi:signal-transduction protein with cAMP-binding, CBS, and nucleotidyltransferase domain
MIFVEGLRDMVPVKLLMTPLEKIQTVDHDKTIRRASQLMRDHKIGCLLVKKDDGLGIVTETDLTRRVMAEGMNPEEEPIERVMTTPILKIDAEATLLDANDLMSEKGIRHLGVQKNGKLVGLISVRDLLVFLTKYPRQ